jgi:hypothetical protein
LFKQSHRIRIVGLVALAFLVAQMGAIAHAYTHKPSTPEGSAYQQGANSHEFCGDCLNFSLQHSRSAPPAPAPASFRGSETYLAFRSRAPPVTR